MNMNIKTYELTAGGLMKTSNQVKEILLDSLERDGLLKESAEWIAQRYTIVVTEKGWLGKAFDALLGNKDESGLFICTLKAVTPSAKPKEMS